MFCRVESLIQYISEIFNIEPCCGSFLGKYQGICNHLWRSPRDQGYGLPCRTRQGVQFHVSLINGAFKCMTPHYAHLYWQAAAACWAVSGNVWVVRTGWPTQEQAGLLYIYDWLFICISGMSTLPPQQDQACHQDTSSVHLWASGPIQIAEYNAWAHTLALLRAAPSCLVCRLVGTDMPSAWKRMHLS